MVDNAVAPRIPADVLAELRWQAETPAAIVTVPKPVLAELGRSYSEKGEA